MSVHDNNTALEGAKTTMTLTNGIQSLISADRPTVVIPPAADGPFQGWGTRIG